jgi:hypothetical protein
MGFPHSEIFGSKCAGNSPKLIAACHVLHRLSVPRHPPNALIVLDLTFCQRNDDLAIIISARSVQGTTPTHETAFLPNPSTLPRRQSEDLDLKTSPLPMNDVKERYLRRHTALCSMRWWRQTGSNRRPPACKAGALPTELCPRLSFRSARSALRPPARTGCYPKEEPIARLGGPGRI